MTITNISDVERELRAEIARLKEWSKLGLAALEYASTGNRRAELIAPAIAAFKQALAEQPAQQTCNCRWEGEVQVQQCTLHEAHVDAIHEWAERAKSAEHQFKNFHRLLCERFGYTHDERDWRRDQLSLIEWIAKRAEQPAQQEPVGKIVDCDFVGNSIARFERHLPFGTLLYTSPPAQRKPLTDERVIELEREVERLNAIINTPQSDNFLRAVSTEAEHQRQRWGSEHDAGKAPADWFWLIGYLAGKALHSHAVGNVEKAEHHVITTAAACANWHRGMFGKTNMRPGIDAEAAHSIKEQP